MSDAIVDKAVGNCFQWIVLAADRAFRPNSAVKDPRLVALSMIEVQCRCLREMLGDGDGIKEASDA